LASVKDALLSELLANGFIVDDWLVAANDLRRLFEVFSGIQNCFYINKKRKMTYGIRLIVFVSMIYLPENSLNIRANVFSIFNKLTYYYL
jgi:hypothetical protein